MPSPIVTLNRPILTKEDVNEALATIFGGADLSDVVTLKPHEESVDGEKTGEVIGMYATLSVKLPGVQALTYDGEKFYTKNCRAKFDWFKLSDSEYSTDTPKSTAQAASLSASDLKAAIKAAAAKKP